MGFPRQKYWGELPFPSPGDLSNPGIEPMFPVSPALESGFFITESPGKPVTLSVNADSLVHLVCTQVCDKCIVNFILQMRKLKPSVIR